VKALLANQIGDVNERLHYYSLWNLGVHVNEKTLIVEYEQLVIESKFDDL